MAPNSNGPILTDFRSCSYDLVLKAPSEIFFGSSHVGSLSDEPLIDVTARQPFSVPSNRSVARPSSCNRLELLREVSG
jgi:hypothetical protein